MKFDLRETKMAGSADAILSDPRISDVYGLFGDKILREFGIDIRQKRTFMSAKVLRQVQSFVMDYGVDDAKKIINQAFSISRKGRFKGRAIGTSLFAKNMRWYADQLLLEEGGDDKPKPARSFWDR